MTLPPSDSPLGILMASLPRHGRVEWIGLRPRREVSMDALAGHERVAAALLRRNVVVSGLPVIALKGRRFRIGEVLLEGVDDCDPCSRMEAALGPGGFNAMRGHGGLCARIVEGGRLRLGDPLIPEPVDPA